SKSTHASHPARPRRPSSKAFGTTRPSSRGATTSRADALSRRLRSRSRRASVVPSRPARAPNSATVAAMLTEERAFASELARRAGAIALEVYDQDHRVELKGKADPVTLADRRINAFLVDALRARFPGDGIV